MDKFTADETVIAAANNAVARGEEVFTPLLCGLYATRRQRGLFQSAMQVAMWGPCQERDAAARNVERFRSENYRNED